MSRGAHVQMNAMRSSDGAAWSLTRPVSRLVREGRSQSSSRPLIVVVESTQDRQANHFSAGRWGAERLRRQGGYVLSKPLMGPHLIEIRHVGAQHLAQMPLAENKQVIEAFAADRAKEAFDEGVRPRRMGRDLEDVNPDAFGNGSKAGPEFIIVIAD